MLAGLGLNASNRPYACPMKIQQTSERLQAFELSELFIEELGWAQPSLRKPVVVEDSGFVIDALNGFPGPYIKYALATIGAGSYR